MKDFTMSMYASEKELYKAKAEYYEKLFRMLAERLVEIEELGYDKEAGEYYCANSGVRL
jgi:hypothetical protein